MERVAFLVERTGERIPCLLNPESVVARRYAGIRPAGAAGARLTGIELSDDPLIFTGGGRTELELDLLFDTSLLPQPAAASPAALAPTAGPNHKAGPSPTAALVAPGAAPTAMVRPDAPIDVRALTGPLWRLAENAAAAGEFGAPPLARFVWGRSWNVLGVISDIAERVEQFDVEGTPARSWLRLRMIRVPEPRPAPLPAAPAPDALEAAAALAAPTPDVAPDVEAAAVEQVAHEVLGGGDERGERLDAIAARHYPGQPWMWRFLAVANNLDDAPWAPAGAILRIPPAPALPEPGAAP